MYSLMSYEQDDLVYDHSVYTITSIYHDSQFKMYTNYFIQLTSSEGRSEYYMNQLKKYFMTKNVETFRKETTTYQNVRDWTKEQRNETIKRTNERVNDSQVGTLVVNVSFNEISNFITKVLLDEIYTIETLS